MPEAIDTSEFITSPLDEFVKGSGNQALGNPSKVASPRLVSTGQQTSLLVAKYLPTTPVVTLSTSFGPVELRPGSIWGGNKMLIIPSSQTVYYAIDDRLYELETSTFLQNEWFNALTVAANNSKHLVIFSQIEIALLTGIFVPWQLLLGMFVAKTALIYHNNKKLINTCLEQSPRLLELLQDFHNHNPKLFNKLLFTVSKDIIVNLPSGVTAEDIAFFIGRTIKGIGGLPDITLGSILRVITKTAIMISALHLPSITANVISSAARENANLLQQSLSEVGVHTSEEEARLMMQDLLTDPDTVKKLNELQVLLQQLIPLFVTLSKNVNAYKD